MDIISAHAATLTEVAYHREPQDFESFAAFARSRIFCFPMATALTCQHGINTAASYVVGFHIGTVDVEVEERDGALPWCLLNAPKLGSRRTSIFPETYCRSRALAWLRRKLLPEVFLHSVWLFVTVTGWWKGDPFIPHYLSDFSDWRFRRILNICISLISAFSFSHLNVVWIWSMKEGARSIDLFCTLFIRLII